MEEIPFYVDIDPTAINIETLRKGLRKLVPFGYLYGIQPPVEYNANKLATALGIDLKNNPIIITALPTNSKLYDFIDPNSIYALTILDGHHRARANARMWEIPSIIITIRQAFEQFDRLRYPEIEEYISALNKAITSTIDSFNKKMGPTGKNYNPQPISGQEIFQLSDF
ncbi:MAG: hypothetical protein KatS3mg096_882 [Candidatus Parcubacteria bacterium]|nr:MAG: hypothetical protein KatS3mg096_882 [Candidatus Parcubacteria bacterium]